MCGFCEKHWDKNIEEHQSKPLSERKMSKYNDGYYTGIQVYVDCETNELSVIACLDNECVKPLCQCKNVKINYCPICGRKLEKKEWKS